MKILYIGILLFLSFSFLSNKAFAQDDAQLSQFYANKLYYTPAAISPNDGKLGLSLTDREQWLGNNNPQGRPSYRLLNATQFFTDLKMGVGISVSEQQENIEHVLNIKGAYDYQLEVADDAFLTMGISTGLINRSYQNALLPRGETMSASELNSLSKLNLDLGFGVEFTAQNLVAGLSINHLPLNMIKSGAVMHYASYGYVSYTYQMNYDWSLLPMVVVRTSGFATNFDINMRAAYKNIFTFGVSFRQDAIVPMTSVYLFNHLSVGYSYDINIGVTRANAFAPSHELVLTYTGFVIDPPNNRRMFGTGGF